MLHHRLDVICVSNPSLPLSPSLLPPLHILHHHNCVAMQCYVAGTVP